MASSLPKRFYGATFMSMGFYESLVQVYDELFPVNPATLSFIGTPMRQNALAVDIGCASGSHCFALAVKAWKVLGLEPSGEMLAQARRKAAERDLSRRTEFKQAGMLELSANVQAESASLLLCIGNTLPHLKDETELAAFFKEASRSLEAGGRMILQSLNYQKILTDRPERLEDIALGTRLLSRRYRYRSDGAIDFFSSFAAKSEANNAEYSVRLYPFTPGAIVAAADRHGFVPRGIYGSWSEDSFNPQKSDMLILDLQKPGLSRHSGL